MTPALLDGVATAFVDALKRALQPRDARIEALEQRLAALEQTLATSGEPSNDKDVASWAVKRGSAA